MAWQSQRDRLQVVKRLEGAIQLTRLRPRADTAEFHSSVEKQESFPSMQTNLNHSFAATCKIRWRGEKTNVINQDLIWLL